VWLRLNEEAVAEALFADRTRREIERGFGLAPQAWSDAMTFLGMLVDGFNQTPTLDPLTATHTNSRVFEAAVDALGSNSRAWATYQAKRPEIKETLAGFDPVQAADVDPELRPLLTEQTSGADARAMVAWAKQLTALDKQGIRYYDTVIDLAAHMRNRAQSLGVELPDELLMLCVVGHLVYGSPIQWRGPRVKTLAGMGFALGSEFFRQLGWNGFKPDRHIIRLLGLWVPELVQAQADRAADLVRLSGRDTRALRWIVRYSLAGIEISPSDNYSRTDHLMWLLGAYVEKKGRESDSGHTRYLSRLPSP
jgi:hypothetical protein